jgi:hypothetical protein
MGRTSAFTSALLTNFPVLQCTGVDNEHMKQRGFGLLSIVMNDLRRDDTQVVTGSSPVRPTKFFHYLLEVHLCCVKYNASQNSTSAITSAVETSQDFTGSCTLNARSRTSRLVTTDHPSARSPGIILGHFARGMVSSRLRASVRSRRATISLPI